MWNKFSKTLLIYWEKFEITILILFSSLCLTALLLSLDFNFLEANLYDLRVSRGIQNPSDHNLALIALDDTTAKELNEPVPLSLKTHTDLLTSLAQYHPKAIGYLIDLKQVIQNSPPEHRLLAAQQFKAAVKQLEENNIPFQLGTPFDVTGEILPPPPLNTLAHAIAVIHKDGNVFSEDKVTRRALLTLYNKPTFHLALARRLGVLQPDEFPKGTFYIPEVDSRYFFFKYHGNTTQIHTQHNSSNIYPKFSFSDILRHRVPTDQINNKIILISTLSLDDSTDFTYTPYSRTPFSNPKLIVHANILDSILSKQGIIRAPKLINGITLFTVTATVLYWIMTSTPLYGVFATLSLAIGFIFISQLLFQMKGIWLRESQPLVGIFASYYLAVPYRLIQEYKQRWDYQRKHELLIQVEELKTNFLSLVTHDLKTPVARIQGLAEVLLRNRHQKIPSQDLETIKHIITSTEDLNRFISNLLELNRVESNHLHLNFESKDINQLIERAIEASQAHAHSQQIEIIAQLEPLFPIQVDPTLISKVLNTLLDNAIKYSPKNSKILIESKEENEWIITTVIDEGIGMTPDEQKNLFTRFYRAKNDSTATISGTGLGLYLTKYFIEVHHGKVEVESTQGKGSTFRIFLPLKQHIKEKKYVQSASNR